MNKPLASSGCGLRGRSERAVTLLELTIASTLVIIAILALTKVDVSRVHATNRALATTTSQAEGGLAVANMVKLIEQADRVVLNANPGNPGNNLWIRLPTGCMGPTPPSPGCFDISTNYQWSQFKLVGDTLRFYSNGCTLSGTFANITSFTITQDSVNRNIFQLQVSMTTDPQTGTTMTYRDTATARAMGAGAVGLDQSSSSPTDCP